MAELATGRWRINGMDTLNRLWRGVLTITNSSAQNVVGTIDWESDGHVASEPVTGFRDGTDNCILNLKGGKARGQRAVDFRVANYQARIVNDGQALRNGVWWGSHGGVVAGTWDAVHVPDDRS